MKRTLSPIAIASSRWSTVDMSTHSAGHASVKEVEYGEDQAHMSVSADSLQSSDDDEPENVILWASFVLCLCL